MYPAISIGPTESIRAAAERMIEADVPATGKHYRDQEMHLWTFNEQGQIT